MFNTENLNISAPIIFSCNILIKINLNLHFFSDERAEVRFFSQGLI